MSSVRSRPVLQKKNTMEKKTRELCANLGISLIERSRDFPYDGDISDLGNEVGCELGKIIENMNPEQIEDFITGLRHGISLTNGTH